MQHSATYNLIVDIMRNSKDLTSDECYNLQGRLSIYAEAVEKALYFAKTAQKSEPRQTPNITMIKCSSK